MYQAVVVARLLYAASAWWGFTTAADRQRIEGFLRRGVRAGYRLADAPTAAQLLEEMDDQLFHRVKYVSGHVLHPLLPSRRLSRTACVSGVTTTSCHVDRTL